MMARLAIVCLALVLPGTAWAGVMDRLIGRSPYPVMDSGYQAYYATNIYWIDDVHVVFVGEPISEKQVSVSLEDIADGKRNLLIWNTSNNSVSIHSNYSKALCARGKYLSYVVLTDKQGIHYREGTLGEEQDLILPALQQQDTSKHYSQLNCRSYERKTYPPGADIALLEGHGYLGWRIGQGRTWDAEKEAPVRYYKDATSPPIELSIKRKDIREPVTGPIYAEWANVYLLLGGTEWGTINRNGQLPKDHPFPIYLLTPSNGTLQTLHTHYQKGVGNWKYQYTRAGLLVFSSEITGTGIGDAGIYRVVGKGYEKILAGIPVVDALSPDGCRLAVGLQMRDSKGKHGPIQLKLTDLCQGGK